jgi:hypothetical protein
MAEIREIIDLAGAIAKLPAGVRGDTLAFLDSTMARFWFRSGSAREAVLALLAGQAGGRVLTREELGLHGVYFPDRAYGEEIFLCDAGTLILPSFMGSTPLKGMHGYHPDDADSFTVLLADPAPERAPRSILEIAPLLLDDLGLTGEARGPAPAERPGEGAAS